MSTSSTSADVGFIRLFFTVPDEESIAYCWAARLSRLLGARVMELRPDTTLSEMLAWAAAAGADSMDFVVVFEPELGMDFAEFLDNSDFATFREMVEHYAKHSKPAA